jgi:hypothetical protein
MSEAETTELIQTLARQLNEALYCDDWEAEYPRMTADITREHGYDILFAVFKEAHRQEWEKRAIVPALTLMDFGNGTWAVTLKDYGPGADEVSTITTFATKEEAEAFIAEERRKPLPGLRHGIH